MRSHTGRTASLAAPHGIEIDCCPDASGLTGTNWTSCSSAPSSDRKQGLRTVDGADGDDGHSCSTRRDGGDFARPRRNRSESLLGELLEFGS